MSRALSRVFSLLIAVCLMLGASCAAFAAGEDEIQAPRGEIGENAGGTLDSGDIEADGTQEPPEENEGDGDLQPVLPLGTSTDFGDAGAGSEPDPNTVCSQDELIAWLAENQSGTVSLGCSITVTNRIFLDYPVTVDTGAYGLLFDKELLADMDGVAQITGEGVDVPVVDIIGTKLIYGGDWNNILQCLSITATGRDGEGGTALRISAPNVGTLDGLNLQIYEPGKIRSYGAGAVGLELAVPFDVYGFDVAAEGEGSVAIYAREGGGAYFCKLSAVGGEAARSEGGAFFVHGCAIFPEVEQEGITVTAAALSDYPIYIPAVKNSDWNDLYYHIIMYRYTATLKETGAGSALSTVFVDYDMDVLAGIDMSQTGVTMIPGTLSAMYCSDWFAGLLTGLDWPAYLMVDVRDPDIPCISSVSFYESGGISVARLSLWDMEQELPDRCILWRSDDDGETWYDCTDDPEIHWPGGTLDVEIELSCIDEGTIFQVEIPSMGESNLVLFTFADGKTDGGPGGDRTGTDRVIGAKPGPSKPAPDSDLPNEDEPDGQPGGDGSNDNNGETSGGGDNLGSNLGAGPGTSGPGSDGEQPGGNEDSDGGADTGKNGDANAKTGDRSIGPLPVSGSLLSVMAEGVNSAGDHPKEQIQQNIQLAAKAEATSAIAIADEAVPAVDLPAAQPALPEPGTWSVVILAGSSAAAVLAAGGYFGLGRRKTRLR